MHPSHEVEISVAMLELLSLLRDPSSRSMSIKQTPTASNQQMVGPSLILGSRSQPCLVSGMFSSTEVVRTIPGFSNTDGNPSSAESPTQQQSFLRSEISTSMPPSAIPQSQISPRNCLSKLAWQNGRILGHHPILLLHLMSLTPPYSAERDRTSLQSRQASLLPPTSTAL